MRTSFADRLVLTTSPFLVETDDTLPCFLNASRANLATNLKGASPGVDISLYCVPSLWKNLNSTDILILRVLSEQNKCFLANLTTKRKILMQDGWRR